MVTRITSLKCPWFNEWNTPAWVRGESCQHQKSYSLIFPPWSAFLNKLNKYSNCSGFQGHQLSPCLNTCILKSLQNNHEKALMLTPEILLLLISRFFSSRTESHAGVFWSTFSRSQRNTVWLREQPVIILVSGLSRILPIFSLAEIRSE